MPVWHKATRDWVKEGRLALLGVTQEQHPNRCRLFAQWKEFDWPILHDPINVMQSAAVPIFVAIDEYGIVRQVGPRLDNFERDFLDNNFADDSLVEASSITKKMDLALLEREAQSYETVLAWRNYGDALVLWGGASRINDAISAYRQAVKKNPQDADSLFRLGVCYQMRHESPSSRTSDFQTASNFQTNSDFQTAVDYWGQALALDPNQYIWRRRIQQYGPRLDKPYPFYDWVEGAIAEIKSRSETPVQLAVPLHGAEVARPLKNFEVEAAEQSSPDPLGRIHRDQGLIRTEVTVVPGTRSAKHDIRVHVAFIPNRDRKAHWNNEVEPLRLWVDAPPGWEVSDRLLVAPQGNQTETNETRQLEFEAKATHIAAGSTKFSAYALYYICEDVGGQCLYRRQDIDISIDITGSEK